VIGGSGTTPAGGAHTTPFVDAASGTRGGGLRLVNPGSSAILRRRVMGCPGRGRPRASGLGPAAGARDGDVRFVYKRPSTRRAVTVGRDVGGGRVEVLSGLAAGERLARPTR